MVTLPAESAALESSRRLARLDAKVVAAATELRRSVFAGIDYGEEVSGSSRRTGGDTRETRSELTAKRGIRLGKH